jgi:hypothetical protein
MTIARSIQRQWAAKPRMIIARRIPNGAITKLAKFAVKLKQLNVYLVWKE